MFRKYAATYPISTFQPRYKRADEIDLSIFVTLIIINHLNVLAEIICLVWNASVHLFICDSDTWQAVTSFASYFVCKSNL